MKRSKSIRLVLIGGLTAGLATTCGSADPAKAPVSASSVYTNNFYLPGVGYYHAPFRGWYQFGYNYFDPNTQRYFYGGQWGEKPFESITNISSPPPELVNVVQSQRTDVQVQPPVIRHTQTPTVTRSGFGNTSHHRSTWS